MGQLTCASVLSITSLCLWQTFLFVFIFHKWYQSSGDSSLQKFAKTSQGQIGVVTDWIFLVFAYFLWTGVVVFFYHEAGTVPVFHDWLNSLRSALLAVGPNSLIMLLVALSAPGAFLHFSCLIAVLVSFNIVSWWQADSCICLMVATSVAEMQSYMLSDKTGSFSWQLDIALFLVQPCQAAGCFLLNLSKKLSLWS